MRRGRGGLLEEHPGRLRVHDAIQLRADERVAIGAAAEQERARRHRDADHAEQGEVAPFLFQQQEEPQSAQQMHEVLFERPRKETAHHGRDEAVSSHALHVAQGEPHPGEFARDGGDVRTRGVKPRTRERIDDEEDAASETSQPGGAEAAQLQRAEDQVNDPDARGGERHGQRSCDARQRAGVEICDGGHGFHRAAIDGEEKPVVIADGEGHFVRIRIHGKALGSLPDGEQRLLFAAGARQAGVAPLPALHDGPCGKQAAEENDDLQDATKQGRLEPRAVGRRRFRVHQN